MKPGRRDLTFTTGDVYAHQVTFVEGDPTTGNPTLDHNGDMIPLDLTASRFAAAIEPRPAGVNIPLVTFAIDDTNAGVGQILLSLTAEQTALIPADGGDWDLRRDAVTVLGGVVNARVNVTPPLANPPDDGITETSVIAVYEAGTVVASTSALGNPGPAGASLIELVILDPAAALGVANNLVPFCVPAVLDGKALTDAQAFVTTPSSSGRPTVTLRNLTQSLDMLGTPITIDVGELTSYTASIPPVIDEAFVAQGDLIAVNCTAAGTGTLGLGVILSFG